MSLRVSAGYQGSRVPQGLARGCRRGSIRVGNPILDKRQHSVYRNRLAAATPPAPPPCTPSQDLGKGLRGRMTRPSRPYSGDRRRDGAMSDGREAAVAAGYMAGHWRLRDRRWDYSAHGGPLAASRPALGLRAPPGGQHSAREAPLSLCRIDSAAVTVPVGCSCTARACLRPAANSPPRFAAGAAADGKGRISRGCRVGGNGNVSGSGKFRPWAKTT
jgi:hypothetical protein